MTDSQEGTKVAEEAKATPVVEAPKTIYWGTGRRKTSVARVRLIAEGQGKATVNGRDLDSHFLVERLRQIARSPLETVKKTAQFDILVQVEGGGNTGQAGAIRLGVARALVKADSHLESTLRDAGHLTRDSRMKERKHYGRRGARRGFQFSKR
ncbi:MAG: 30S ribosomal protein S9 [Planctomycetes bacterium]|nr:30S ribosomal protein S9 [Planctomycetota bacterium]